MRITQGVRQKLMFLILVVLAMFLSGCAISFTIDVPALNAQPAFRYDKDDITVYNPHSSSTNLVVVIPGDFINYGGLPYTHITGVYIEVYYKRQRDTNWIRLGGQQMEHSWRLYEKIVDEYAFGRYEGVPWEFECWFRGNVPDARQIKEIKVDVSFEYDVIQGYNRL